MVAKSAKAVAEEAAAEIGAMTTRLVEEAYARGLRQGRELGLVGRAGEHGHGEEMTVTEAREQVRLQAGDGVDCPVCFQRAKVYPRALTSVAVRALTALYLEHGRSAGHMPTIAKDRLRDVAHQGGYLVLSQYWGLMVDERSIRTDGGRAGYWRVTDLGEAFLRGQRTVPKYALIYNGVRLELRGDPVTAASLAGDSFDYQAIMARAEVSDAADGARLFFLPEAKAA